jgi:DNA-directed RNA polymerase subunit H (RpoH/RPB5)
MDLIKSPDDLKYTVLQNIVHMLVDRKFLDKKNENQMIEQIKKKINSDDVSFTSDFDDPYLIHVKFLTEQNVGKKQNLVKMLKYNDKKNHYILILIDEKVSKFLKEFKRISNIEIFDYEEFYFNVTSHELVPKHILLNDDEVHDILMAYNIKKDQLPKIFNTDRIVRHYNMKIGSICKIEQISPISGKMIAYRQIITNINQI